MVLAAYGSMAPLAPQVLVSLRTMKELILDQNQAWALPESFLQLQVRARAWLGARAT